MSAEGRPTAERRPPASLETRLRGALAADPTLLPPGRVLVAVSGGPDSTALLHLLLALRSELDLELRAAHFDHGARAASREESALVADACGALDIPCVVRRADRPLRTQEEFRDARYAFLHREAERAGARRIAVAHHRRDSEETVLTNLLRGTGWRGLTGIPARRGRIVRPLLEFEPAELRSYLRARGIRWLEDPSNHDRTYTRARLRDVLLPTLRAAGWTEEAGRELARCAEIAERGLDARATRLLERARVRTPQAHDGAQIARSVALDYDRVDLAWMVRIVARGLGFRLSRRATRASVDFIRTAASGRGVELGGGLRAAREFDRIVIAPGRVVGEDRELSIAATVDGVGRVVLDGRRFDVEWGETVDGAAWTASFPRSALTFPLRVRAPRPGDRIRTEAGTRKIKKLLNERRVPRSERPRVPVVVGADRVVLWVAGHSIAVPGRSAASRDEESFAIGIGEH
ncbi:MAG: tRNA lysidine(34) synthetase TilS [Gemmatimonadetes bacterium]|nr:tRNA lysidine(34) synthetase TilS [Gemmatimonadota bacterium]